MTERVLDGRSSDPEEELDLAERVARAFFLEDRSRIQIAGDLGLSRFQVARLLQLARTSGIVRIEISRPERRNDDMGAEIARLLGVDRVVVVAAARATAAHAVGRAVADELARTVRGNDVVGLTWSRTMLAGVQYLHDLPECSFVQLAGQLVPEGESTGGVELVYVAAQSNGGVGYPIYAPFLLPDARVATALRSEPAIHEAVRRFDDLDVAAVAVGAWESGGSLVYDVMTPEDRDSARGHGVVGEINGNLLDAFGNLVANPAGDRILAISLEQIRRTPHVVCSAFGAVRAAATVAAMRSAVAGTFVIDEDLAAAILEMGDIAHM